MAEYSKEEWLNELRKRFGENQLNWAFVCPACGKITKMSEFKEAGAKPNDAYSTCIGRHNGKGVSGMSIKKGEHPSGGCDWAAFGLFGTLGKGDIVISEDGTKTEVFAIAPYLAEAER